MPKDRFVVSEMRGNESQWISRDPISPMSKVLPKTVLFRNIALIFNLEKQRENGERTCCHFFLYQNFEF